MNTHFLTALLLVETAPATSYMLSNAAENRQSGYFSQTHLTDTQVEYYTSLGKLFKIPYM